MAHMRDNEDGRPRYMISVAAELSGMHPQTLRIYERRELIKPQRSAGNTRLYSDADIARLRMIQELTNEGLNLSGVVRIIELESELRHARLEIARLRAAMQDVHRRLEVEREAVRREYKTEIVMVRRGGLARRD